MTSESEVAAARTSAQKALFEQIEKSVPSANTFDRLERLARAYRYVAGGAQPGSSEPAAK